MTWRDAAAGDDTGLRNLDLLDAAIAQAEAHPEDLHQMHWRCKSGMCIASWTAWLAGARWRFPAGNQLGSCVLIAPDGRELVVSVYAREVLGLSEREADRLFHACNSLEHIKAIRDRLRREAAERGANHG